MRWLILNNGAVVASVFEEFSITASKAADNAFLHIPARACQHYSDAAIDLTYDEALQEVTALAQQYRAAGYGGGQRIALVLENRAQFFLHWFALNSLGCSVLPISSEAQPTEIAYFLEHAAAVLIVALPETAAALESARALLANPPAMLTCDEMDSLPDAPVPATGTAPTADTECALLYTSGSTGKPKGCILSNEYFISCGRWYTGLGGLVSLQPGQERLLTPLPLGHMNAMAVSTMAMVMSAGCIIQLDRFHPTSWWQSVRESNASVVHYLGVLPALLLELAPTPDDDCSGQIRFGFGAGVNPKHQARFEQRFGFPLIEAWAMTESGCAGCIIANHEPRHVGSCCFGKPPAELEIQLVDEQRQPVASGEPGELRVRRRGDDPRAGFFSGYLHNPQATAAAWQDGWLNTGDIVRQSADGSLHFVDRRKNVIRRSGENISALEVEAVLSLQAMVLEALVTPVPDDIRGDEVAACVVLQAGIADTQETAVALLQHCSDNLAYYKAPGYVLFCTELPKTASNKPRRGDVKVMARERVSSGACYDLRHLKKRQQAS